MYMGIKAKDLAKLAKHLSFKCNTPEMIDVEGFFDDGRRVGKAGLRRDSGSIGLAENIKAFYDGYDFGFANRLTN